MPERNVIRKFDAYSSTVELIEIAGKEYVLKTVDPEETWNEKRFLKTMGSHNLPTLEVFDDPSLRDGQLLLEYVPGSEKINFRNQAEVERWGSTVAQMHAIHYPSPFQVTKDNTELPVAWNRHLRAILDEAVNSRSGNKTDLSDTFLKRVSDWATERLTISPEIYSLIHGDLHDGNTLKRGDDVIIYDKSSEIFAGDRLYDLAIVMHLYPHGIYAETDFEADKESRNLLNAFMKGYGEDFMEKYKDIMDLYMVIRTLDRYPNQFVPLSKNILENIVR